MNENWKLDNYSIFIENLKEVQLHWFYSNEFHNKIIDYILSKPEEEASFLIEVFNDFYTTGAAYNGKYY